MKRALSRAKSRSTFAKAGSAAKRSSRSFCAPSLLHFRRRGLAMPADPLVQILPIAAGRDPGHQDRLARHERQLLGQIAGNHLRINDQPRRDVLIQHQQGVDGQEGLRQHETAIGAVVKRALEPLRRGRRGGARFEARDEAGQAANPLGPHRIAFVRHRGRADLLFLERLFEFLAIGQEPQIGGRLVRALSDAREGRDDLRVDLVANRFGR